MSLLLTLVAIVGYMVSPIFGFVIVFGLGVIIFTRTSKTLFERQLEFLVITMPLYMTPLVPGFPPIFSWTTLMLVVVSSWLYIKRSPVSPASAYLFMLFIVFGIVTALVMSPGFSGLYYFAQLILFIIPPVLAFAARGQLAQFLDDSIRIRLLHLVSSAIMALALGVLLQWQLHVRLGIELGEISYFASRTTYDLLIPAYSVVSGILGVGMVLGPILWRRTSKTWGVCLPLLSGMAILVNSSRTGLVAGAIATILLILFPPQGVSKFASRVALIPVLGFLWWLFQAFLSGTRASQGLALLDDNGRFETFRYGFKEASEGIKQVLLGIGYTNHLEVLPHNFLIQTVVCSGIVVFAVILIWIFQILKSLKGSDWFYPVVSLLIGSMFYSGFYGVKAFSVITVIAVVSTAVGQVRPSGVSALSIKQAA